MKATSETTRKWLCAGSSKKIMLAENEEILHADLKMACPWAQMKGHWQRKDQWAKYCQTIIDGSASL